MADVLDFFGKKSKSKEDNAKFYHYVIIALILFFLVYVTANIFTDVLIHEKHSVAMKLKVEGTRVVGINTDTDMINFGIVPGGSTGIRRINVTNNYDKELFVVIKTYGNFSDWISVSDNEFRIQPGSKEEITIKAKVPRDTDIGVYRGRLEVVFQNILW